MRRKSFLFGAIVWVLNFRRERSGYQGEDRKYKDNGGGDTWSNVQKRTTLSPGQGCSFSSVRDSTWNHPHTQQLLCWIFQLPSVRTECLSNPDNQIPSNTQQRGISEEHIAVSIADTPPKVVTTLNSTPTPNPVPAEVPLPSAGIPWRNLTSVRQPLAQYRDDGLCMKTFSLWEEVVHRVLSCSLVIWLRCDHVKLSETHVRLKYGVKWSDFYLWCISELLVVSQSKTLQKPILISWLEKHKWLVCITGVGASRLLK